MLIIQATLDVPVSEQIDILLPRFELDGSRIDPPPVKLQWSDKTYHYTGPIA